MIRNKTKELVKKAEDLFAAEPSHFSKDYAKYGMLQILIDSVIEECIDAVQNSDLRSITITTYDKENYDALRVKFMDAIKDKHGLHTE